MLGFLAGAAAVSLAGPQQAQAVNETSIMIKDERAQRANGFDIIYEARDLDLDQDTRDGLSQARKNLDETKQRVKESEARIDALDEIIAKDYW